MSIFTSNDVEYLARGFSKIQFNRDVGIWKYFWLDAYAYQYIESIEIISDTFSNIYDISILTTDLAVSYDSLLTKL